MPIPMMKGARLRFKKIKQAAEYKLKQIPVAERNVSIVTGIPKYSLKFLNTTNKQNAVSKAPKLSIRKIDLGLPVS